MKYAYTVSLTNKYGDVVSEKTVKTISAARAKFAAASIAGMFPERLIFDETFNKSGEMSVYAEFTQPDFKNYNQMLGFIQREELEASCNPR